jgi:hypothetical protein
MASAASLRLEGDRAWLEAEGTPLSKVLRMFEQRGIEVLIDPSLQLDRISGEWENTKVDRMLQQLVAPNSYLLEWKKVDGPLGELYQISAIRIFSDGNMSAAKPLSSNRKILDVVKGPDGMEYVAGEILIGFDEGSTVDDLRALLAKVGGTVVDVIDPPGLYRIKLNEGVSVESAMETALEHDGVKGAEPNLAFPKIGGLPTVQPGTGEGINLHLQPGETAVAVFDSGLDPQYADLPFIRGTYNALNPSEPMSDSLNHGTMVALVASGAITPIGAEPGDTGVPVLAVRTFDENGYTSSDTIMRALDYAANSGVDIVNMSWGSEVDSEFMELAMDYAAERGLTLYAAAGNEPTGSPIYPAGYSSVIAVGGLAPDGTRWERSNYGDFVERYAPAFIFFNGQTYRGTSFAGPYEMYLDASKRSH